MFLAVQPPKVLVDIDSLIGFTRTLPFTENLYVNVLIDANYRMTENIHLKTTFLYNKKVSGNRQYCYSLDDNGLHFL